MTEQAMMTQNGIRILRCRFLFARALAVNLRENHEYVMQAVIGLYRPEAI